MDQKSLTQILAEGENQKQVFMLDVSDKWNTAILISSLANTDGGSLWIGVKSSGKITGVYADGILKELEQLIKQFFQVPYKLESQTWKNKVHFVVEVKVAKSKDPVFIINDRKQSVLFYRHSTKSIQASKITLKEVQFKSQDKILSDELSAEELEIINFLDQNGELSLSQLYKRLTMEKSKIDLILSQLVYRKLVEKNLSTEIIHYRIRQ